MLLPYLLTSPPSSAPTWEEKPTTLSFSPNVGSQTKEEGSLELYSKFVILTFGLDIFISSLPKKSEKNHRVHLSLHLVEKFSPLSTFKRERVTK